MALQNPQIQPEVLAGILSGLANAESDYIAEAFLPGSPTDFIEGSIPILAAGGYFGLNGEDGQRQPGGDVSIGPGIGYGKVDYECQPYYRGEPLPKELQQSSQIPIPLLTQYTQAAVDFVRVGRERRLRDAIVGAAGTWAYDDTLAGVDVWDQSTSDPIADVSNAVDRIVGGRPNKILMGRATWKVLSRNATVLAALSTNTDNLLMSESRFAEAFAAHFGVLPGDIHIGRAQRLTTNNPDDADDRTLLTDIHEDYFWIGRIGGSMGPSADGSPNLLMSPTAMANARQSDFADNAAVEWDWQKQRWVTITGVSEHIRTVTLGLGALIQNTET